MELYQLRSFVTVAKTGHLTRAAAQLATSQPALSSQIKALEEEFNLSLFIRTTKGMLLTAAGQELLNYAEKILDESENLRRRAKHLQTELVGTLRVGLNENGSFLKIQELCNLTASKLEAVKLDILTSNSYAILKEIEEEKLDCGFVFGDFPEKKISGFAIHTERILVTAPVAWKDRIENAEWKDLLKFPWAWQVPSCPYRRKAEDFFKNMNLTPPDSIFSADHDATILAIVASGTSIGLVKEADAVQAVKKGQVVTWDGASLELDLFFVFKQNRQGDPLMQAFSEIINEVWNVKSH